MKKVLSTIVAFFLSMLSVSCAENDRPQSESLVDELWVMIKIDSNFRDQIHLDLVDKIAARIEGEGIGYLDGHSSGAHQFEFNFVEITDFKKAKTIIEQALSETIPSAEYQVSNEYEMTFEKI